MAEIWLLPRRAKRTKDMPVGEVPIKFAGNAAWISFMLSAVTVVSGVP